MENNDIHMNKNHIYHLCKKNHKYEYIFKCNFTAIKVAPLRGREQRNTVNGYTAASNRGIQNEI